MSLMSLGKMLDHEKQCKHSPLDKKIKNQALRLAQVIFDDSVSPNQGLDYPVNK